MLRRTNGYSGFGNGISLAGALAGVALFGCTLGGADEGQGSPYDEATITVSGEGVADGVTPVEVVVTGPANSRLTVEVANGALFEEPDPNTTNEKTLFMRDDDGDGVGTGSVFATSKTDGSAPVFFKVDPLDAPASIVFNRVRFAAAATPSGFTPGRVVHDVCMAVNTSAGKITVTAVSPGTIDTEAELSEEMPSGLDCPADDGDGWVGYARLEWLSPDESALATVNYVDAGGDVLATDTVELTGATFAGYEVSPANPVVNESFLSVQVTFTYADVGSLTGELAKGIKIVQRFIPVNEATDFVLGTSSGTAGTVAEPLVTGNDGKVTVFFNPAYPGTYAWFLTPEGGAPAQLTVVIPEPAEPPVE